ncbi:MAG: hypothetical protein OXI02_03990 [Candidatus Dadabacteria bacterium]|nr:hypothetical protein [Candidatus Dadabacteria bacterium]MDE0477206.1 hypothetical protein [Candidatus Dadabacteria bacterium]
MLLEKQLLKKTLNTLIELKASIRDTADPGVIVRLDEVIDQLQSVIEGRKPEDPDKILNGLGKFLKMLPSIEALMSFLSDD